MARPKTNTDINGHKYYRIRRTIDGVQKSFYGSSKGDAERKYRDYVEQRASRSPKNAPHSTFGERAEEFIGEILKPSQKYAHATKYRYELAYRTHVQSLPIIRKPAADIRASDIQSLYNSLDVSKQTLATVNKFMSAMCRWMVRCGYASDFMSAVEIPQKPENRRHDGIVVWEPEEIEKILTEMQGHRLCFFVWFLLYTGARMGEAIALRYDDIEDGIIHIRRQCYMGEMKAPKYGSARDIPMHEELLRPFEEHRREHLKESDTYVFTTASGKMLDPVNVRRSLRRFCEAHSIEYKHPHAFRSTFCTQLCRCGVPLEVASSLMGHKSIEVTAKHYAFVKTDTKEDAIRMLSYRI